LTAGKVAGARGAWKTLDMREFLVCLAITVCSSAACGSNGGEGNDAASGETAEGSGDASASASETMPSSSASASDSTPTTASSSDTEGDETTDPGGSGESGSTGPGNDWEVWELRIDNYAVPTQETAYQCFEWSATLDQLAHIVGFNAVIDNAPYVHHYVVSTIDQPTGQPQGYSCFDQSGDLLWAWAPGADEYLYPEETGILVGDKADGRITVRIQVHYNNPLGASGQVDSSGLDVYLSTDLRQYNAGTAVFADVGGILIPPGDPAFEWIAECTSSNTQAMLSGPITVFGSSLHAHNIGSVLWTDIERGGEFLLELNRDDPYNFANQTYKPIDDVVLQPGDAIINHCIYDSSERTEPTHGGLGTAEEMCWNTMLYYPRENANFDYCGA
jgi:hypothetical protein